MNLDCNQVRRYQGLPYPRTCRLCGICGPCRGSEVNIEPAPQEVANPDIAALKRPEVSQTDYTQGWNDALSAVLSALEKRHG